MFLVYFHLEIKKMHHKQNKIVGHVVETSIRLILYHCYHVLATSIAIYPYIFFRNKV